MPMPTASQVTRLFLYDSETIPSDLASDSLIRPSGDGATLNVDVAEYMNIGPGRFAVGTRFDLVNLLPPRRTEWVDRSGCGLMLMAERRPT